MGDPGTPEGDDGPGAGDAKPRAAASKREAGRRSTATPAGTPRPGLREEIAAVERHAAQPLTDDVQSVLADLMPLMHKVTELDSRHRERLVAMARSVVPLITTDQPNLAVCRRMVVEIALLFNWQRSALMRVVYTFGRGRAGSAVLAGMGCALAVAMTVAVIFVYAILPAATATVAGPGPAATSAPAPDHGELAPSAGPAALADPDAPVKRFEIEDLFHYEPADIFPLLLSAFLGSLASIVISLSSTPERDPGQVYEPETIFFRAFFKPLVAMIFALAVFSVLMTDILSISGLNLHQQGEAKFHVLWVLGFFSGFSERFAPRIFGQVDAK